MLSNRAKAFIGLIALCGTAVLTYALAHWQMVQLSGFLVLLAISVVASRSRLKLPGLTGTMSMNLPFILVAVVALSASESTIVGCISTFTQCLPGGQRRLNTVHVIFNVCNMALAVAATRLIYDSPMVSGWISSSSLRLLLAAAGFFLVNSVPVAIVISLTENSNAVHNWAEMFQLSYPYYVASAGIAGAVLSLSKQIGWLQPMLMLLIMLGILHSYRRYFFRTLASGASQHTESASLAVGDTA